MANGGGASNKLGGAAVVTGAGRGIGRTIALQLAASGLRVGLTGRDPALLNAVAEEVRAKGGTAATAAADVTDWSAVQHAFDALESQLGEVDLLVNNAGAVGGGKLWDSDMAGWWRVIEVNLRGPLHWCRAVLPGMVERDRGRVVNVTGYVGIRPSSPVTPYAVAKAGLIRLTDSLAEQLAATAVKVFAISPGTVRTGITTSLAVYKDFRGWDPPELAATLILRIAAGEADPLSGRLLHVRDDLDEMLGRIDEIVASDLYQLRLYKRPGERQA